MVRKHFLSSGSDRHTTGGGITPGTFYYMAVQGGWNPPSAYPYVIKEEGPYKGRLVVGPTVKQSQLGRADLEKCLSAINVEVAYDILSGTRRYKGSLIREESATDEAKALANSTNWEVMEKGFADSAIPEKIRENCVTDRIVVDKKTKETTMEYTPVSITYRWQDILNSHLVERSIDIFNEYLKGCLEKYPNVDPALHYDILHEYFGIVYPDELNDEGKAKHDQYIKETSHYAFIVPIVRMLNMLDFDPEASYKKADVQVVVQGGKGVGKTSFWVEMLPKRLNAINQAEDLSKDPKEIAEGRKGKAIAISDENAKAFGKSLERLKSVLTSTGITCRLAYRRDEQEYPHRCVAVMTTNEHTPLPDDEELRRWFVVQVEATKNPLFAGANGKQDNRKRLAHLKENRDKYWASAYKWVLENGAEKAEAMPPAWCEEYAIYRNEDHKDSAGKTVANEILAKAPKDKWLKATDFIHIAFSAFPRLTLGTKELIYVGENVLKSSKEWHSVKAKCPVTGERKYRYHFVPSCSCTGCAGGRGSQGLRKKLNIEYQQLTIFDVSEENVEAVTSDYDKIVFSTYLSAQDKEKRDDRSTDKHDGSSP